MTIEFSHDLFLEASKEDGYYTALEHCYRRALSMLYNQRGDCVHVGIDKPAEGCVSVQKMYGYWFVYEPKDGHLLNLEKFDTIHEACEEIFRRVAGTSSGTRWARTEFYKMLNFVIEDLVQAARFATNEVR